MRRIVLVGLVVAMAGPVRADWVVLKDGHRIRGIDLKKQGDGYLFTVESGKTAFIKAKDLASSEKSPPGEKVEFRGKQVTLREMVLALQREHKERQAKAERAVETWARGDKKAEEGRAELAALPRQEQEVCFGRVLANSSSEKARALAASELGSFSTTHALKTLAISAVIDRSAGVRETSIKALKTLKMPRTGDQFVPFLMSRDQDLRMRASLALRTFPTLRAVPALMVTIHKIWSGGGRSYFFQGAQRAYIGDYELVSGGTAFTLTEVADPIVRFAETGVVLDAKIVRSEETIHLTTLEAITGQHFGESVEKWREWWKTNGETLALKEAALNPSGDAAKPAAAGAGAGGGAAEEPRGM